MQRTGSKNKPLIEKDLDCLFVSPPARFSRYPYLGICSMAAVLRTRGISTDILDCAAWNLDENDAVSLIADARPRMIAISIMSLDLVRAYPIIQGLKHRHRDGIIVVGGSHLNADPEIIRDMGVTYGFRGECDFIFADFCEKILSQERPSLLPGMIVHRDGEIACEPPTIVDDLDSIPVPAYDLLPLDRYFSAATSGRPMAFNASRGCPFNCIFCSKLQKTSFRTLGVEAVVAQCGWLVNELKIGYIEFVDELFTLKKNRVLELCGLIVRNGLRFQWGCNARADVISEELVIAMKAAGCVKISFGVETGSERIRYLDHKRITNDQYVYAVNLCKKHGIQVMGFFIFGHPGETIEEMKMTAGFAKKLKTDMAYFHKMVPIPNSELFEAARAGGEIRPDHWTRYMLGSLRDPIYYPRGISPASVHRVYRRAWWQFYLSPRQIKRYFGLLLKWGYLMRSLALFIESVNSKRYQK
jgi:anaerobic magnesium-protoporphyrin IX monomethyl ester cyclase